MKNKTFFTILAWLLLAAMVIKVVPWDKAVWGRLYYATNNLKPGDVVPDNTALDEAYKIRDSIDHNARSYPPGLAYRHVLRLQYLYTHITDEFIKQQIHLVISYAARTRESQVLYSKYETEFSKLTNNEEFMRVTSFTPVSVHCDLHPLWQYEAVNFWPTILLAIPFWIAFRLRQGKNPLWDLLRPWMLLPALVFWPVGMYFLLVKEPVRKIVWLAWACAYLPCYGLAFVLSLFSMGVAKAQEIAGERASGRATISDGNDPHTQTSGASPTVQILALADESHTHQTVLTFTDGGFVLMNQNQRNMQTGAASSFTGIGAKIRLSRYVTLSGAFGPQYNLVLAKVDATGAFVNANISWKGLRLTLINRLTFGFERSKTASTDRHIQSLRGPPKCSGVLCRAVTGLSIDLEEKHVEATGRWMEVDMGLLVNPGQVLRVPDNKWGRLVKVLNIYGFYDTYLKRWDRRLWLSYSHQFGK